MLPILDHSFDELPLKACMRRHLPDEHRFFLERVVASREERFDVVISGSQ